MILAALFPLAQSSLDPATQSQAFVLLGGIAALSLIANQIMGAVINFRKLRGADPADDRRYASRAELDALHDEVTVFKSDFSALSRTINNSFSDLQRSIGRIEGKLDSKPGRSTAG